MLANRAKRREAKLIECPRLTSASRPDQGIAEACDGRATAERMLTLSAICMVIVTLDANVSQVSEAMSVASDEVRIHLAIPRARYAAANRLTVATRCYARTTEG